MRSDLPRLMSERNLDALIIHGADGLGAHSAAWNYMVAGQQMHGDVIVPRSGEPMILYSPMEVQAAQATGLKMVSFGTWDLKSIAQKSKTRLEAAVETWRTILSGLNISGRVAFYGGNEMSTTIALIDGLRAAMPSIQIVGEYDSSVIDVARRTKDATEIRAMEEVGRRCASVVAELVAMLSAQRAADNLVVDPRTGKPLTIGDVKQFVARRCDVHDLEQVGDNIFAQGRDAGIPHARGDVNAPLRTGESIIFDFFPRCRTTGYFHDLTRTFALGHATPGVLKLYDDVKACFDEVMGSLTVDSNARSYHVQTCDIFRKLGHKVILDTWPLEEGYCHSLGHGLGLEVHESPGLGGFVDRGDTLAPGSVVTIEPGLYYPDRGMGCRIEDTVVIDSDGTCRSITPVPYDLVIPLRG
jgi:Xaa-Pro aminopeptidase